MNRKKLQLSLTVFFLAMMLMVAGCSGPANSSSVSSTSASAVSTSAQQNYSQVRVSYLGPEGTYTQEACNTFFDGKGSYLAKENVSASVKALLDGEVDYAVIPQENTIGGPVIEYLDEVISHPEVSVAGEVELPINQNLLVKPGAKLQDIKTVYSHKQGITQGSAWLAENLPQAQVVEVSSTAEGAKKASEADGNDCAAIAAAAAADVYGLEVAAEGIQQNSANKTRFYVLTLAAPSDGSSDRMAFIATGKAGDLPGLMASVKSHGLQVVAVHDRPEKSELGKYVYLIECSGAGRDSFAAVESENPAFSYRYLGSYPLR